MKLEFLGTGAADWNIENRKEGEFFRRWSSVLVNGELLIDPGPHIFDYAEKEEKPELFDNVKAMLVTHSHPDHLNHPNAERIHEKTGAMLHGYKTVDYRARINGLPEFLVPLDMMKEYEIAGYKVIAFQSNHKTGNPEGEITYNYYIEKDGKSFFYGCDSGWLMTDVWDTLKKRVPTAIVFELTTGDLPGNFRSFSHTSIPMLELMVATFDEAKVFSETKYFATHLARTLHTSHGETAERLKPINVTPVKDGDIIEI